MAPLPHNNTPIYFVDYATANDTHTLEVRAQASVSPATFGTTMNGFLVDLSPLLNQITVQQVRFQASGSNVSNPVTSGIEGNTYGSGAQPQDQRPYALNFVGRSSGGRRVRLMLFGYKAAISAYRLTTSESAEIDVAVARLNGTTNTFLAIDGLQGIWKPYANVIFNAYWQRKTRAA